MFPYSPLLAEYSTVLSYVKIKLICTLILLKKNKRKLYFSLKILNYYNRSLVYIQVFFWSIPPNYIRYMLKRMDPGIIRSAFRHRIMIIMKLTHL